MHLHYLVCADCRPLTNMHAVPPPHRLSKLCCPPPITHLQMNNLYNFFRGLYDKGQEDIRCVCQAGAMCLCVLCLRVVVVCVGGERGCFVAVACGHGGGHTHPDHQCSFCCSNGS